MSLLFLQVCDPNDDWNSGDSSLRGQGELMATFTWSPLLYSTDARQETNAVNRTEHSTLLYI